MENKENRKASDILLELENIIKTLVQVVGNQDFNIKILSEKLNKFMAIQQAPIVATQVLSQSSPQFTIEAFDKSKGQILVQANDKVAIETQPKGFRRTSRPETYAGDDSHIENKEAQIIQPKISKAEVIVPKEATSNKPTVLMQNAVPVIRRIVDKNGKSVFLADVEIIDLETEQNIHKTRTNGTGKWSASLPIGNYRILARKRESLTKQKLESVQEVKITGDISPLELQIAVIK